MEIRLKNIKKNYGSFEALKGIDLVWKKVSSMDFLVPMVRVKRLYLISLFKISSKAQEILAGKLTGILYPQKIFIAISESFFKAIDWMKI
mgnify:CR=1 FL=1